MRIHIQSRFAGKCTGSVCVCVNSEFSSVRISTD